MKFFVALFLLFLACWPRWSDESTCQALSLRSFHPAYHFVSIDFGEEFDGEDPDSVFSELSFLVNESPIAQASINYDRLFYFSIAPSWATGLPNPPPA